MRKRIEYIVDCDTSILYGPLDKAIEYLKKIHSEHPNVQLEEEWTGYEKMHMRFLGEQDETDQEMNFREMNERDKKKKEADIAAERKRIENAKKEVKTFAKSLGVNIDIK